MFVQSTYCYTNNLSVKNKEYPTTVQIQLQMHASF